MDLASIETNRNPIWDDSIESILSELGDESQINAFMHKKAQTYYTKQNIKYQLPIIVLSALSGTGNFISANFPDYSSTIILAVGGISIFTSIISSVAQFLKVSQLSESHRMSYLSWEKYHSTIKFQLNKRRSNRDNLKDFISLIIPEYQRLKEISAEIPKHIYQEVKRKKNIVKMQIPYMLNGFHPVTAYKEPTDDDDDDDDDNNNGLINIDSLNLNIGDNDGGNGDDGDDGDGGGNGNNGNNGGRYDSNV